MIKQIIKFGNIWQIMSKTLAGNAYIIEKDNYLIGIDALLLPQDSRKVKEVVLQLNKPLRFLINTHFHSDHCLGNRFLKEKATLQINHKKYWETITAERALINPSKYKPVDKSRLTKPDLILQNDYILPDGEEVIITPGHSADSICLYLPKEKVLFSGDTILHNNLGKYSLPYFYWGSYEDLVNSLHKMLKLKIKNIFPGHGVLLTGNEKIIKDLVYLENLKKFILERYYKDVQSQDMADLIGIEDCLNDNIDVAAPQVHELNIRRFILDFF